MSFETSARTDNQEINSVIQFDKIKDAASISRYPYNNNVAVSTPNEIAMQTEWHNLKKYVLGPTKKNNKSK